MTGTGVPKDERKGLKWIHKATFQGYQPAIDYCKEHGYKWTFKDGFRFWKNEEIETRSRWKSAFFLDLRKRVKSNAVMTIESNPLPSHYLFCR